MRASCSTAILLFGLITTCATAARAQDRPPSVIADEHGNLIVKGKACEKGVTVGALHQARDTSSQIVSDAARQALHDIGLSPVLAKQAVAGLQPEITPLERGDGQTCVGAVLFVPRSVLAAGPTDDRAEANPVPDPPTGVSPKPSTEPASLTIWEKIDSTIQWFVDSTLAKIIGTLAALITLTGTGLFFHAAIVRYFHHLIRRLRHRKDV